MSEGTISEHLRAEVQGYICPETDNFVVEGHFLDRGFCSVPKEDHPTALRVTVIYKTETYEDAS